MRYFITALLTCRYFLITAGNTAVMTFMPVMLRLFYQFAKNILQQFSGTACHDRHVTLTLIIKIDGNSQE